MQKARQIAWLFCFVPHWNCTLQGNICIYVQIALCLQCLFVKFLRFCPKNCGYVCCFCGFGVRQIEWVLQCALAICLENLSQKMAQNFAVVLKLQHSCDTMIGRLKNLRRKVMLKLVKKNLWSVICAFWALVVALFWTAMRVIWSGISKVIAILEMTFVFSDCHAC